MQAQLLAGPEWLGRAAREDPLILLGDFNSLPGSPPFQLLTQQLHDTRISVSPARRLRTFPTRFPSLAVDHIFVNERLHVNSLAVVRSAETRIASDHFPLVAELRRVSKRSAAGG